MKKTLYLILTITFLFISCKEEGRIDYIDGSLSAPDPVSIKEVISTPGGAIIKYGIPNDKNLLGVKAVYFRNGELCETKASKYVDTLIVEGFGDINPEEVQLYSIGFNGKLSEPISTTVKPLPPPIKTVEFDMEAGFGGVTVSLQDNSSEAALSLALIADTISNSPNNDQWIDLQTFHTKSTNIKFSRRGLEPRPMKFGVYIKDRWNNVSDTIYKELTPIEEIKLPKDQFQNAALPTDTYAPVEDNHGYRIEQLWLGPEGSSTEFFATKHSSPIPQWWTIDLGRKMSISRIQKWPRPDYELYSSVAPRTFEVWGSENPNPDGSWDDSWFLLGEFEQFKPSGYGEGRDVGPITDEDKDYWYNETEFEVIPTDKAPDPYQPVTHLRFKILSTFGSYGTESSVGQVIIAELTFWGQLVD